MSHRTTLHYNETLLRQAVTAFWRRSIGVGFVVAMVVVAAALAVLLARGDRSWLVGTFGTVLVLALVVATALYVLPYRDCVRKFRDMESSEATFVADESTFTFSSSMGTSTAKWSAIKEVWRFGSFWLLGLSKAQFVTLPLADVPPEMQVYVLQRVEVAGGKIDG